MSIRKLSGRQGALSQWSLAKLKAFNGDRSGTVAIIFAVSAIAIVALLGAAFDISRAMGDKSKIQSALDQAVFAAAQAAPEDREAIAQRLFLVNTQRLGAHVTTPIITTSKGTVTGTTTGATTTAFLGAANVNTITTTSTSSAPINTASTAQTTGTSQAHTTATLLRWAPPTLVHPTTIVLGTGETSTTMDPTKDYIIRMPTTKKVGYTFLIGGHNIVILGGYVTIPVSGDTSNDAPSRAIYIKNATGTVHIEGLLVDASGGGMSDGIDISAPAATVQVENVRVDGIFGFSNEFHADVIQPFGGVKDLRVDMLTGFSGYQGLTIGDSLGRIGSAELYRINLVSTGTAIYGAGNNGGYLIWLTPSTVCAPAYPVTLSNVYVQPRSSSTLGNSVWPPVGDATTCGAQTTSNDAVATFPSLPVTGYVIKGLPPQGDYVPVGVAGLNYQSPGYMTTPN